MDTKLMIQKEKIVVICRRVYGETLLKLAEALNRGGIKLIEVTFDQNNPSCIDDTTTAIRMLEEHFSGEMQFGAGTVLTVEQVLSAKQAGSRFIISPHTSGEVIRTTKENGLVSIPGAMTPSEIVTAHGYGADIVKLFPAATMGMKYIKDISAPINHIPILATGGVTEENFGEFLSLGMVGAGISGRLTDKKCILEKDFEELARRASVFCTIAKGASK